MAAEPEIEAVREALASRLSARLAATYPSLKILADWPSGTRLPEMAISILATGEADDIVEHPPIAVAVTPDGSGPAGTVTYVYGYIKGIQLELDVWAATKPDRDALALAVRREMNQPPQATIAGAANGWPQLGHRANLTLAVPGLFGALFTYRFTQVPTFDESSEAAQKYEWRSHWRGTADGPLWDQDAGMPLRKAIGIVGQVGPGTLGVVAGNQQLAGPRAQIATVIAPTTVAIQHGTSQQLTAYAIYNDGTTSDVTSTAAWSSSSTPTTTVAAGLAHGVAAGTATLTATSGGFSGTCLATVS